MSFSTPKNHNLNRGYTIALVSAATLSTTAIFVRHLTQTYQIPPLILAFWRDVFVVIALLPVLGLFKPALLKVKRQHLLYLIIYGLMLAIFNALWTMSVSLNGAAISNVLVYSSTGFTALLGWWLLNENLNWVKLLAVALSLAGSVLVSEALDPLAWRANITGIITGILSGLLYAIYSLMGRSASQRGLNPWSTLLFTFGFAAIFLLFFNLIPAGLLPGAAANPAELLWLGNNLAGWGFLLLLAAGPTVVGYGLYNVSLGYLPSSVANLILTLEPVFTVVVAYLLLDERLNCVQLGGGLMILIGVFILRIHESKLVNQSLPNPP
ncbi:MAG TPA: DMT family transporter [Anaerolineae bacterium]|nr:DMT family transporter [Anaerolineae bacterium]